MKYQSSGMVGFMDRRNYSSRWQRYTSVLLLCASIATVPVRLARAEVIDRVVAVIEDEAIFLSDLQRRMGPFERELMAQVPNEQERAARREQLYRRGLEEMVDDSLLRRAAQRLQIRVTDADVNRLIDAVASRQHLSRQDLIDQIRQQGVSEQEYREIMEAQTLRLAVLERRVRSRVNITPSDVANEYERRVRLATSQAPFQIAHIFFAFPQNPSSAQIAATQTRAEEVALRVMQGEDFAQTARQVSEDPATRENGGDLGLLYPADDTAPLPDWLMSSAIRLSPGQTSHAVRGDNGYHVFRLISRESVPIPPLSQVRAQLASELLQTQIETQQRNYFRELRRVSSVEIRL